MKYIQKLSIALALFCAYAPSLSASAGELFDLIAKGDSKQVEEFLENGGKQEINTPITNNWAPQWTPLYLACNFNNLGIVEILLKNGANPNTLSNGGKTPLYIACCYESLPMIELLLKYGADATLTSNNGESPLSTICTWRIKERKELLMMLIPSAKNLPQNTKTFIELVISTLADQIQESSTIAPKVPQNDGLFRSPVVENPGQKIACIEEFTKILF